MATKLPVWDQRMLQLMDYAVTNKIKCTNQLQFCKLIGVDAATISQVKKKGSSFRHKHILTACKKFGIRPDYIYGFTNNMLAQDIPLKEYTPTQLLQEALRLIEKK